MHSHHAEFGKERQKKYPEAKKTPLSAQAHEGDRGMTVDEDDDDTMATMNPPAAGDDVNASDEDPCDEMITTAKTPPPPPPPPPPLPVLPVPIRTRRRKWTTWRQYKLECRDREMHDISTKPAGPEWGDCAHLSSQAAHCTTPCGATWVTGRGSVTAGVHTNLKIVAFLALIVYALLKMRWLRPNWRLKLFRALDDLILLLLLAMKNTYHRAAQEQDDSGAPATRWGTDHPAHHRPTVGDRRWAGAPQPQRIAQRSSHGCLRQSCLRVATTT